MDAAVEKGIGRRTLMKAKSEMNIQSERKADGWYWKMDEENDED